MTSKQKVIKAIEGNLKHGLAMDFSHPHHSDILTTSAEILTHPDRTQYPAWGYYEKLLSQVPHFNGEVMMDCWGNIYGRLEGKTKGECVLGVLESGWDALDSYEMPHIDEDYHSELMAQDFKNSDKFVLGYVPVAIFSVFRDMRLMGNALIDTALFKDEVKKLLQRLEILLVDIIEHCAEASFDGLIICDDWGTQLSTFISPESFREIFKPLYKTAADKCHEHNMKLMVHSCGMITKLFLDFIEVGVDVMQLDQPELFTSEYLADELSDKIAFYCPVDIQKTMATGDRKAIEDGCRNMIDAFQRNGNRFIIKDYPSWQDINIDEEWANWARAVAKEYLVED